MRSDPVVEDRREAAHPTSDQRIICHLIASQIRGEEDEPSPLLAAALSKRPRGPGGGLIAHYRATQQPTSCHPKTPRARASTTPQRRDAATPRILPSPSPLLDISSNHRHERAMRAPRAHTRERAASRAPPRVEPRRAAAHRDRRSQHGARAADREEKSPEIDEPCAIATSVREDVVSPHKHRIRSRPHGDDEARARARRHRDASGSGPDRSASRGWRRSRYRSPPRRRSKYPST